LNWSVFGLFLFVKSNIIIKREVFMSVIVSKEEAHKLVDQLSENASWDDLMHEIYVRETIERGLEDSKAGRTKEVKEIRTKYGLPE